MERTLVLIKPDAVKRGLVGEIITRFERVGLSLEERFSIILAYCRKKRADIQYRDSDDHRYSYIKTP